MMRRRAPWLALALLAAAAPAAAAGPGEYEVETGKRPEPEVALPAYPKEQDLFLLDSPRTGLRYLIDTASIQIGEDRVVRYTAVVRTPGGAVNVTYEGIDCATVQKRIYALGLAEGSWTRAKESGWSPIADARVDHHRYLLYDRYFCALNLPVRSPGDAVTSLRRGGTNDFRNRTNSGFPGF